MLQTIARLKLLTKGLLISDIASILGLQPFQEVQFSIELYTVSVAGGPIGVNGFQSLNTRLCIREL